jgi:outer membrane lipoprotein-sorting protein
MHVRLVVSMVAAMTAAAPAWAQPAKTPVASASATSRPVDSNEAIQRANATLNSFTTMTASFTQVGGEGNRLTGMVSVQRPGKLRFEYNKPSVLEVISDGSTVLVRDRKQNTSDPYPISQTPLKFLLSSRIDLQRDTRVRSVSSGADGVSIVIEDASTFGGTSRITLTFDNDFSSLKRWRVVDPQGYTTTVTLAGIEKNVAVDPRTFNFGFMRPVE